MIMWRLKYDGLVQGVEVTTPAPSTTQNLLVSGPKQLSLGSSGSWGFSFATCVSCDHCTKFLLLLLGATFRGVDHVTVHWRGSGRPNAFLFHQSSRSRDEGEWPFKPLNSDKLQSVG